LRDVVNFEIIFVNDGSRDNSQQVIGKLVENDRRIKFVNLTRNFGHQAAITAGMNFASGNMTVTMDCDLQDPPELIVEMMKKHAEGARVVYARRKKREDSFFKKYSAKLYYSILKKVSKMPIMEENIGDFRLIDRKVMDELKKMNEKSIYLRGMIAWLGFNYAIIDYDRPLRKHGNSGFSLVKMVGLAMDGILGFSLLPLRLGFFIGLICILAGLFFLGYISYDAIFNHVDYPLYKWLTIALVLLVGFMFILLWVMAEYIGRIFDETKGRPVYVIDSTGNIDEA